MEGSNQEINIDVKMRKEIIVNYEKSISVEVFDKAFNEITRLICHNCVSSFLTTEHATKAKTVRDWFTGFEDFSINFKRAVRRKILDYPIETDVPVKKDPLKKSENQKLGLNFNTAIKNASVFREDEQEEAALKKKLKETDLYKKMTQKQVS